MKKAEQRRPATIPAIPTMHTPITTLKTAARESESATLEDTIRRIFNLKDQQK